MVLPHCLDKLGGTGAIINDTGGEMRRSGDADGESSWSRGTGEDDTFLRGAVVESEGESITWPDCPLEEDKIVLVLTLKAADDSVVDAISSHPLSVVGLAY